MPSVPTPEVGPLPNADLAQLVAAAADLCRKPWRHAVLMTEVDSASDLNDCCLRLEVRDPLGKRLPPEDLDLELYRSGQQLNLTLSWTEAPDRPILWHGQHPVWMLSHTGERCARPDDGQGLEALARRLRSLLS